MSDRCYLEKCRDRLYLYLDEMRKNADYAQSLAQPADITRRLRRKPPRTLVRS